MIRKYIPDTITSMNLVCGIIGVVFAFRGRCDIAFCMMLAAAVFDFLDGFAARALDSYSDMGKELDSLCDLVSFGVLPAVMLYNTAKMACSPEWVCWSALLIAVFSALRLAKFNVDPRQTSGFIGLATPACAMLVGSLCCYVAHDPASFPAVWMSGSIFVPVLVACLCFLLVSEIPMFSLKMHKDDPARLRNKRIGMLAIVICAILICLICKLHWSLAILLIMACYIVKNIVYHIFKV